MPVLASQQILAGRYRLERPLGEGGMGVVWSATRYWDNRVVALKFLRPQYSADHDLRRRLLREARAAQAIRHPNVVEILEVLELEDGVPALAMELLSGETLQATLDRFGRLPLNEVAGLLQPIVSALRAAHALGIVHRDLKPENLFLQSSELSREWGLRYPLVTPKVLDFGIVKLTATEGFAARSDNQSTHNGVLLGTPLYMSPEQLEGERVLDARSDIYSLGVVMFQCLCGQLPTTSTALGALLLQVTSGKTRRLADLAPSLPYDVCALVTRMLHPDPDARPTLHDVETLLLGHASTMG